ncbi:MAG: VOC family protein [Pseudonocardiaceae bacterium]
MIEDDSFIPGSACWIDVSTADPAQTRDFYAGLFGWTYRIDPNPRSRHYTTALLRDRPVAGIAGVAVPEGQPVTWTLYLNSANVAHIAMLLEEWEGWVHYGPVEVAGQGSILIGADPTGAVIGFWQPATTTWTFHTADPGSLVWAELNTWDGRRADGFFASMFGYRQQQIGDGIDVDYTTWALGERTILGRRQLDGGQAIDTAAHWMLYFAVNPATGTDYAVNRVLDLGGRVTSDPFDSGLGRIAVVQDPSGATFSLIDPTHRIMAMTGVAGNDDPYDD